MHISIEHPGRRRLGPIGLLLACACTNTPTADATESTTQQETADGTESESGIETESESDSGSETDSESESDSETEDPPPDMSSETGDEEVLAIDLLPLTVGNSWEFDVLPLNGGMPFNCPLGPSTMTVAETLELDGRSAFRVVNLCGNDLFLSIDGDAVDLHLDGEMPPWKRFMENPVEDGHEWLFALDLSFRWAFHGSISVPAGDFDNCWRREVVDNTNYIVYCPGVGEVHSYQPEGEYEAVLLDYTLN
jgi:hypothetical protein